MSRRLSLLFAGLALFAGCMDLSNIASAIDDARAVAKIGVVAHPEISWPKSAARFRRSLEFFKSRKVDAIVVLGELTHDGYMNQYRVLATAWDDVFNNPVKGVDPNPPRRILILGEKERAAYSPDFAPAIAPDVSAEGGEFDVNGFRFHASAERPAACETPAFFADSKPALTDELCWYPRTRVAINAGSLTGVVPRAGYEEVKSAASACQGLLVTAYSSSMTVSRIDFGEGAPVAPDWQIALGPDAGRAKADTRSPEFWADTTLRVLPSEDPKKGLSYKVEWPPVLAKHTGVRAQSYEVDALVASQDGARQVVAKRLYVLSPNFWRGEDRDTSPVSCRFYASDLPAAGELGFRVTPISSFGERGRPIEKYGIIHRL